MTKITHIATAIDQGDARAAEQLLPLVYGELRRLAAQQLSLEKPGQTLQATALVHEAYLRLVGVEQDWDSRGHFFAAAAEAMRRILIENARRKKRLKRGGNLRRVELDDADWSSSPSSEALLEIDDALQRLAVQDAGAAQLVKLRFFGGFSVEQAAKLLGISRSSAYELWAYAKAWLRCELADDAYEATS